MNNPKEQNTGIMEKQYLDADEEVVKEQETDQKSSQKSAVSKLVMPNIKIAAFRLKNLLLKLKSSKILILFSIILVALITFLVFLNLSSKSNYVPGVDIVELPKASPTGQIDTGLQNIQKQVDSYNSDLKELGQNPNDFVFPQVDLKIQF